MRTLPPPRLSHCYRNVIQDTTWIRIFPGTSGACAGCSVPLPSAETALPRSLNGVNSPRERLDRF